MKFRFPLGLKRFWRNKTGVAAVEFALIAPIMITTYFGSAELCHVLLADRKVTNMTSAAADLVAQAVQISNADMDNIFEASSAIMEPYPLSSLEIIITSVVMQPDGDIEVAWSDGFQASAHTPGTFFPLPEGLVEPGGSVIVAEVRYSYATAVGELMTSGIVVEDTFYQRPRRVMRILRNTT